MTCLKELGEKTNNIFNHSKNFYLDRRISIGIFIELQVFAYQKK